MSDRENFPGPSLRSPIRMKGIFWAVTLSLPILAAAIGIELVGYRTIPPWPITVQGDPIIMFDAEIGFAPFRQGVAKRSDHYGPQNTYNVYTDRRGARVSRPGEQTGERVTVLFVGDSFTWGAGIESEDTFAYGVAKRLNVSTANLSMGSYGTTQSLQMLRRNLDLAPRLIVHAFIDDHLQRNVVRCAQTYYPFCLDQSYVTWRDGSPMIAAPFSNGVRRTQLHVEAQQRGLWPLTWVTHGLDVALGKILLEAGNKRADASDKNKAAALEFLLGEISKSAKSVNAELLIVYIPLPQMTPPPAALTEAVAKLNLKFLNLLPAFESHRGPPLHIPDDGHPSVGGHSLIAQEIASAVRARGLLHP